MSKDRLTQKFDYEDTRELTAEKGKEPCFVTVATDLLGSEKYYIKLVNPNNAPKYDQIPRRPNENGDHKALCNEELAKELVTVKVEEHGSIVALSMSEEAICAMYEAMMALKRKKSREIGMFALAA
jgi:hypothetical protein